MKATWQTYKEQPCNLTWVSGVWIRGIIVSTVVLKPELDVEVNINVAIVEQTINWIWTSSLFALEQS